DPERARRRLPAPTPARTRRHAVVGAPLSEHVRRVRYRFGLLGPAGARARQAEKSMIFSADDEARPSARLLAVSLEAAAEAQRTNLAAISERLPGPPYWPDIWPGE